MSKHLQEQFITYYVVLGELSADAPESARDAMYEVHKAAYALVKSEHRALPNFKNTVKISGEDIELTAFELCQDDSETKDFKGKVAWPISVYAEGFIPGKPLIEMRDLVISAYARAAAAVKPEVSVRFADAERQQTFRVTETVPVDFANCASEGAE